MRPKSYYGRAYSSEGVWKDKPPYAELIFVYTTVLLRTMWTLYFRTVISDESFQGMLLAVWFVIVLGLYY